jgi:hypothetical protein
MYSVAFRSTQLSIRVFKKEKNNKMTNAQLYIYPSFSFFLSSFLIIMVWKKMDYNLSRRVWGQKQTEKLKFN